MALEAQRAEPLDPAAAKVDAYVAPITVEQGPAALALAKQLRAAGLSVEVGDGSFRLKKSFEVADAIARHIVIVGEDELASNIFTVKNFASGEQTKIDRSLLDVMMRRDIFR